MSVMKWGQPEFWLIEVLDCALRFLAQALGVESYGECISVMAGKTL
jgi:hypothetical protein